jgi:hypothetical protein
MLFEVQLALSMELEGICWRYGSMGIRISYIS